jgi:hypothetical protein
MPEFRLGGGSRASALLSGRIGVPHDRVLHALSATRPTSGLFRTALTGELEGETAPAVEVGGCPSARRKDTRSGG